MAKYSFLLLKTEDFDEAKLTAGILAARKLPGAPLFESTCYVPDGRHRVQQTATHWNVYVGKSGGQKYLQNSSPIAIGTTTYDLSAAPALSGNPLWSGQVADGTKPLARIAGRG